MTKYVPAVAVRRKNKFNTIRLILWYINKLIKSNIKILAPYISKLKTCKHKQGLDTLLYTAQFNSRIIQTTV